MRLVRSVIAASRAVALSYLLISCRHSADGGAKATVVDRSDVDTIVEPKFQYGYMIVSTYATRHGMKVGDTSTELPPRIIPESLGMKAGDTLAELLPTTVPESLRALTDAGGHPVGTNWGPFDPRCVRYFASSRGAIVLDYMPVCITNRPMSFEYVPVLFQRDSRGALRPVGVLLGPYVEPYARFINGDSVKGTR